MNDLIDTTEMYLKAIIELEEESVIPLRARISERLAHSGPTVSQTVSRMERDGLLFVGDHRQLELTEKGRKLAVDVMRKHRLAERLLSDVIGLNWELVHDEACRWEHVMSEQVEERLLELLPISSTSPYGNPVPGLEAIGGTTTPSPAVASLVKIANASPGVPMQATIAWLGEPIQVDLQLLRQLKEFGVVPGAQLEIKSVGSYVSVGSPGADQVLDLPDETAAHVFVTTSDNGI